MQLEGEGREGEDEELEGEEGEHARTGLDEGRSRPGLARGQASIGWARLIGSFDGLSSQSRLSTSLF